MNAGVAMLSVRQWSGKPYQSKQIVLEDIYSGVGIQEISVEHNSEPNGFITYECIGIRNPLLEVNIDEVIKNDGLSRNDFWEWFKKPLSNGGIIHFTDLKY